MKNMIRGLVEKVRGIRSKIKCNRVIKNTNADGVQLFVDIGSSSIKVLIGNEYINFRDSIREVTNRNELWSYVNILDTKSQTFLCCTSS